MSGPGSPERPLRVDWVRIEGGLTAYIDDRRVATGDWDQAGEAVRDHLARLAGSAAGRLVYAEFHHAGASLGTVTVDAAGTVLPVDTGGRPGPAATQAGRTVREPDLDPAALDGDPAASVLAELRRAAARSPSGIPGFPPTEHELRGERRAPALDPTAAPPVSAPNASGPPMRRARSGESSAAAGTSSRRARRLAGASRAHRGRASRRHRPLRRVRPAGLRLARHWNPRSLVIALAGLVAITLLGATLTVLTRGGHPTVALVHDEEIGVRPPAEWQSQARWRTPPLLKDAGRVLMIDGTRMAFVTKDRTIALTDVGAGTVLWSGRYPDGEPHTGLGAGRVDGRRVVVAHVGNRLAWWDLESGTAQEVSLPDGASVNLHGSTPLVVGAGARTAGVVRDGRLRTLPVPAGATPLAARDDGTVTAAGPAGWWHLSPDTRADQPTPWENPRAAGAPTIVAYVDGSILSILPAGTGGTAYLAVYSDRTDDVRFAWGGSAWFDGAAADWYPSPSRRWGIFGRTLVDLANARSVDLGSWTTQLVGPDRAVGMLARQRVLVGPTLPSGAVPDDEAVPEDIATTAAAVRAKDGDEEVVYLLPPKAA